MAVAPGQPSQAAVARHFAKDVTLFDGQVAVRTLHTLYYPTAVQLLSTQLAADTIGGPLVAVAEGPQVGTRCWCMPFWEEDPAGMPSTAACSCCSCEMELAPLRPGSSQTKLR